MSQLNNFSPALPACWGGTAPGAQPCDDCRRAELESHHHPGYMAVYSPQMPTESVMRSTIMENSSAPGTYSSHSSSRDLGSSDSFSSSQYTLSNNSSADSFPKEKTTFGKALWDYTPSTVPDSLGRTPPPMDTPPNMSFSNYLAYIDGKLLEIAADRSQEDTVEEGPRFPPGLTPPHQGLKRAAPVEYFVPIREDRPPTARTPPSNSVGPRRTLSTLLYEPSQRSSSDTQRETVDQFELEHNPKRRKLRQHDSNASAHTFVATEPASLRKARSLGAGPVNEGPRLPTTVNPAHTTFPPIVVPTIWPRDAALTRLGCLLERERNQRADDARCRMTARQPISLEFDGEVHFNAANWLFSVQGLAGDTYKPIRRHLRTSTETRVHAALLFSRYAARLSCVGFNPFMKPRCEVEGVYQLRVRTRLVQEIALGCLTIAAKFQRDFLLPLRPLTAEQFLDLLGEEHPVAFDDLELVQNTIMRSFDYILYQPTPQAYLQEFWMICPTLQGIQDGTFDLHKSNLQARVSQLLEACLLEYEAIDYPISCLTASALLEALHLCELHQQCTVHSEGRYWDERDGATGTGSKTTTIRVCAACVNAEICAAMHIHLGALTSCRDWVMTTWIGLMDD